MADLKYTARIDTRGAVASLDAVKSSIAGVGAALASAFTVREIVTVAARFQDLRTSLGAVYQDAERGNAVFEDIKRLATETTLGVENLTEATIKLQAAGLAPTVEQLKLFADVSSVTTDQLGTLQALTDLFARTTEGGLGLEDLNRLADRGIPVFKILGDTLGISRLEVAKFGQSAEGAQIILQALSQELERSFGGASAARAQNLSQAFANLGDGIQNLFDEIGQAGLNDALARITRALADWIERNQQLIAQIGSNLGAALDFLRENFELLTRAALALLSALAVKKILEVATAFVSLGRAMRATPLGIIATAAGAALGLFTNLDSVTQDLTVSTEAAGSETQGLADSQGRAATSAADLRQRLSAIDTEARKTAQSIRDIGDAFALAQKQQQRDLELQLRSQDISRNQLVIEERTAAIRGEAEQRIFDLRQRFAALDDRQRAKQQGAFDQEIARVQELADASVQRQSELLREIQRNTEAYDTFNGVVETTTRSMQRQLELAAEIAQDGATGAERVRIEERVLALNEIRERSLAAIQASTSLTREQQDLLTSAIQDATTNTAALSDNYATAGEAVADLLRNQQGLSGSTSELFDRLPDIMKGIADASSAAESGMRNLRTEILRNNSTFESGFGRAFQEYQQRASDAAATGRAVFETATRGMEDAITTFVKTGKLSFRSLIQDIVATILQSQVRNLIAQIFGGGGGGGGGGNLLSSLFAGFFATGGRIPPGKYGVVGEAGPELVQGPASVTPMGRFDQGNTGRTQVVYNINAVDAASFRSLIARDPEFLFAVTEQGRKSLPPQRR